MTLRFAYKIVFFLLLTSFVLSAKAQEANTPPYESQLINLADTLGALHYLSNLCSDKKSQKTLWRDQMNKLLATEKADEPRKKNLISAYNNSYRTYSENYNQCTDQALKAIENFKMKGQKISENLLVQFGN